MRDLPSGTVTFLFTDVEGSTQLLRELGAEAYADALAEHRRVIREACARHAGVEVDTQGDAFFFAFPTATGAIGAAAKMTEALASRQVQVRVGLHTGTPLLADEGYVGDDVHLAARVAASGHGGQVLVSYSTAALIEPSGSEPQALSLVDLGEHRLKDIEEAVSIFQLGDGSFPPLKTISNTNLPRPASSFVGREAELAEVLARIDDGARLVTLTGPGGSGKTRLALEAASSLVPEYKAGVFWIGLASLRDPALVIETIAQILGAKDGLASLIAEREMLLLLDNLEQVIEAASELSELLQACPNLTLLATSRELLRISGEVEYAVPPLAQPEAVELFCNRSQLEPSDEIAELCVRLDSLPLAVELAAARTKALTPAQILERLSQRLDLLKGGRDADPRQQTLRATIEWSYELLSDDEQQLFGRLSVFAGGCTLEAAEVVCDADLDTLQSLVEKSLLRFTNERYWMLETIREFAGERLDDAHDTSQVQARHARWFEQLAKNAEPRLIGLEQRLWLDRLSAEHDNLRASLAYLDHDRAAQMSMAISLWRYWQNRNHLVEGRTWLNGAEDVEQTVVPELAARFYVAASRLAWKQGDFAAGLASAEIGYVIAAETNDAALIALSGENLGNAVGLTGELERCRDLLVESVRRFREVRDDVGLASALNNLGGVRLELGQTDDARSSLEESASLHRGTGNAAGLRLTLQTLAYLELRERSFEDAGRLLEESLQLSRDFEDIAGVGDALEGLGHVAEGTDGPDRAVVLWAAGAALRGHAGFGQQPLEQAFLDMAAPRVKARLGEEKFASAWEAGSAMTLDEAVEYALTLVD